MGRVTDITQNRPIPSPFCDQFHYVFDGRLRVVATMINDFDLAGPGSGLHICMCLQLLTSKLSVITTLF